MGLADEWWFWPLALAGLGAFAVLGRRWGRFAEVARRRAVASGLVSLGPGQALPAARDARDRSWLALAIALWVGLGPWIWGYDDSADAVTTALVTGAAVLVIALAGVVFPALWALGALAGLWLVVAPWVVGYGDANGPVGLSDTVCGLLLTTISIASLSAAERRLRSATGGVGRLRPPNRDRSDS